MTHIAVIGAGIVGAAIADRLVQAGAQVSLIEISASGSSTSETSLAWLNANRKLPRSYYDLSVRAMHEWTKLADGFGQPDWYVPTGHLTWATGDQQLGELATRITRLREWDYPLEEITPSHAVNLEPLLRIPPNATVTYFPTEGFVHTQQAIDALVARAQGAGARLVETGNPAVLETNGVRITAVRLPNGDRIQADVYLCCTGWRTPQLLSPLGVAVPMIPGDAPGSKAPCFVTRMFSSPTPIRRVITTPHLKLRPIMPGGLHLEASNINALVDCHTEQHDLDRYARDLVKRATEIISTLATPLSIQGAICVRPLPADGMPIVGWLPQLANAYLVVTHSGVTLAPLLARLVVSDVLHAKSDELAAYSITRFSDTQ